MKTTTILLSVLFLINLSIAQTQVTFQLEGIPSEANDKIGVRGNELPLSWEKTFYLTKQNNQYIGKMSFDSDITFFEYKYVAENQDGQTTYELDGRENRLGIINDSTQIVLEDTWDVMPVYDIASLPLLPPEKLQQDAAILGEALWAMHPGVERYQDSLAYFTKLRELSEIFSEPKTYATAYKEISKFVATLKCGHTYANPYNQTGFIQNIILNQEDKLPLGMEWIDSRLIITKNATNHPLLEPGTEIISINNMPVRALADSLLLVTKGDGSNDAKRFSDLKIIGYDRYEVFDVYFPLFVQPRNGKFALVVVINDGKEMDISVKATTRKERNRVLMERYPDIPKTTDETWAYQMLEHGTAYLKMGTFTVWNFQMDWKKFLKEAFKSFEKAKASQLIIDIRGNEGGLDEVIAELQQYVLKEDCTIRNFDERIRYQTVPEDLTPYLFTWDQSMYDFSGAVERNKGGWYSFLSDSEETSRFKGSNKAFQGDIYLLVDAANSSATFYLARFAKECGAATLAGETTGGSKKGINGGNILFLRLLNSGIEVDIPVYGQFDVDAPDGGIVPDIVIPRTASGIRQGVDVQLDELLRRISKQ